MTRSRCLLAFMMMAIPLVAVAATGNLGTVDFPNSGAPEAQEAFLRGVLLLHSFEYEDAREAFQDARRRDPAFVMAAWGEAMTHNHPLWREQDRDAALEALNSFAPTPEARAGRAPTERERGYLAAVDVLYGEGDKVARDLAYGEAMGRLAARFPGDLEARAFHALSILGTAQGVRDFGVYMKAGAVAEEVFAASPRHPGAAHYMIHSYDDPVHAPLGLRPARVYAQIAPAAAHAQHMISHIYVALGEWADSVDANVKSFEVSVTRRKEKALGVDALNYHALQWLAYSYLQLGRFDEARSRLDMMTGYAKESGSPRALWHHAAMRAAWIVETGGRPAPDGIRSDETQVTGAAADLFATGYAALLADDVAAAEKALEGIGARHDTASAGHLCGQSSGGYRETSRNDLIASDAMRRSLRALIEVKRGNTATALTLLEEATADEEKMPLDFGPPMIVKALARAPRRSLSLAGAARAAAEAHDLVAAAKACDELAAIYAGADASVSRPGACPVRPHAGRAADTR